MRPEDRKHALIAAGLAGAAGFLLGASGFGPALGCVAILLAPVFLLGFVLAVVLVTYTAAYAKESQRSTNILVASCGAGCIAGVIAGGIGGAIALQDPALGKQFTLAVSLILMVGPGGLLGALVGAVYGAIAARGVPSEGESEGRPKRPSPRDDPPR